MDLFVASFAPGGERLRGVTVKGELVVKAETRDGESACSSYRAPSRSGNGRCVHKDAMLMGPSRCGSDHDPLAHKTKYAEGFCPCLDYVALNYVLTFFLPPVPTEFTSIPFPIKALKLVLAELQSDGEPASLSFGGVGLKDIQDDVDEAGSDDGEWSDDDVPGRPEPTGALSANEMSYVKEMLGGQEVPQGVFAALGGGINAGVPSTGGFDDDTDYEGDDEDLMRDPIVQVDMQVRVWSSSIRILLTVCVLDRHMCWRSFARQQGATPLSLRPS